MICSCRCRGLPSHTRPEPWPCICVAVGARQVVFHSHPAWVEAQRFHDMIVHVSGMHASAVVDVPGRGALLAHARIVRTRSRRCASRKHMARAQPHLIVSVCALARVAGWVARFVRPASGLMERFALLAGVITLPCARCSAVLHRPPAQVLAQSCAMLRFRS